MAPARRPGDRKLSAFAVEGKRRLRFQGKKGVCGSALTKARRRGIAPPPRFCILWVEESVNILDRVVDVELAGRGDQVRDASDLLERGIIVDDDLAGLAGFAGISPQAHPNLRALFVVFDVHGAAIATDFPAFVRFARIGFGNDANCTCQDWIGV